jgi:peptide/nickel transport system ATP-binding protein
MNEKMPVLSVRDLTVEYYTRDGWLRSLDNITLDFEKGKVTALIGESGCGKSTIINAMMGVLAPNARLGKASKVSYGELPLLEIPEEQRRKFRWQEASMVFQAAQNAMNPTLRIEEQLLDSIWDHDPGMTRDAANKKIVELLEMVRLDPERVLRSYPHELSGGMRQRAIIAMAMVLDPKCIILDEPTTALDMITQHFIFDILTEIQEKRAMSMIIITHDIALAAKLAHNMVVMYGGEVMEIAPTEDLFDRPGHPYTKGLLEAIPFIDGEIVKKKPIRGSPPDLINKTASCIFHQRCRHAVIKCSEHKPLLEPFLDSGVGGNSSQRQVACWLKEELRK